MNNLTLAGEKAWKLQWPARQTPMTLLHHACAERERWTGVLNTALPGAPVPARMRRCLAGMSRNLADNASVQDASAAFDQAVTTALRAVLGAMPVGFPGQGNTLWVTGLGGVRRVLDVIDAFPAGDRLVFVLAVEPLSPAGEFLADGERVAHLFEGDDAWLVPAGPFDSAASRARLFQAARDVAGRGMLGSWALVDELRAA